jgi:hypothetical protein
LPCFESFVIVAWWWTVQTETCSHASVKINVFVFVGFVTDCFEVLINKSGCPDEIKREETVINLSVLK